jgi:hypothetical protein
LGKQRREGRSDATPNKNRWLLEPTFAAFGARPIGEVTAPELLHANSNCADATKARGGCARSPA